MSAEPDARLLLAVLRGSWGEAERLAAAGPVDADAFVGLARACDVHPTVHAALERADRLELVGGEAARALGELRSKVRSDNLLLLARAEQTLDLLLAARIVPVALKGLDVLHRLYERFDERALDDVDLLVRPGEFERALAVLERAGYRAPSGGEREHWLRSGFEMPLYAPGPVEVLVELHWGLGQEERYRVPADEVVDRAVPLDVAGRAVKRLEPHDAAAHLLLHHVQHYFDRRLKWMLELARIAAAPGFSWNTVADRVDAWGGRAAAGMALRHVARVLPRAVPREARRALPASPWRRIATLPLRSRHPLDLFRGTRDRRVQLWLAAALYERPAGLPRYLLHRARRDRVAGAIERLR